MNYQNKTVVTSEESKWEEWLKESTEPETEFTSEEIEFVNGIQHGIGFTDEELEELEKIFGQQPSKPRDVKKDEKDHQEWTQLTCIHPKEYTIINEAGGTKFKYCKRCKKDLGDVLVTMKSLVQVGGIDPLSFKKQFHNQGTPDFENIDLDIPKSWDDIKE
jgi:hypothetical protein